MKVMVSWLIPDLFLFGMLSRESSLESFTPANVLLYSWESCK